MASKENPHGTVPQPKAASDVEAAAIAIDQVIPLPPLDAAAVKTAYESNPNTNAFTDAASSKLATIEANATADQTGTEIVQAINTQLGGTTWQGGGGGGGTITRATDSLTASNGATATVRRFGPTAITMTGDAASGFDIVVPLDSEPMWINFKGDSATANAQGDLVIRVNNSANGYDLEFLSSVDDEGAKQDTDEIIRGHILSETVTGFVTTLTMPNIGANYPSGFTLKLR